MNNICIKSLEYYVPEGRISNDDVLNLLRSQNAGRFNEADMDYMVYGVQRKFDFLGISERSYWDNDPKDSCLAMAVRSAQKAIDSSGVERKDIECVIFSSVTNPFREPSFAIALANKLNIEFGDFFDVNDTCNGFLKSIELATMYLKVGKYSNILVVCSENPYELQDGLDLDLVVDSIEEVDNRISGMIVGCGSASMIISSDGRDREIKYYAEKKTSSEWDASLLTIPGTLHSVDKYGTNIKGFWSDARLISSRIIKEQPRFITDKLKEWDIEVDKISIYILHQLGNNVTFALLDKIGADHSLSPVNTFNRYGNLATVNIPLNLKIAEDTSLVKNGDTVLLINSACGLSYSVMVLSW